MYSTTDDYAQITFHYVNGETEAFNLYTMAILDGAEPQPLADLLQQYLSEFLEKPWVLLQLPEETVCIHLNQVIRIDVKPSLELKGLLGSAERLTPLSRNR